MQRTFLIYLMFVFFSLFQLESKAALDIPSGLNDRDERDIVNSMGPATAARLLSAPYPLGGFQGFELGIGRQFIPTELLTELGDKTENQKGMSYPIFSIGKGLFNDVDMFLTVIPFMQSPNISHFAAQTRIGHWYSQQSPILVSSVWHIGSSTIKNQITFENYGFDLLGTLVLKHISLYTGLGTLYTNASFVGGEKGITKSGNTDVVTQVFSHKIVGVDLRYDSYFIAAQVDSYEKPNYSFKLGYRF